MSQNTRGRKRIHDYIMSNDTSTTQTETGMKNLYEEYFGLSFHDTFYDDFH